LNASTFPLHLLFFPPFTSTMIAIIPIASVTALLDLQL
jgi:hypothetical protein